MVVIDGKSAVMGRLAVAISKELKKGEKVDVVNAEKIIITGDPVKIVEFYKARTDRGERYHGPFFPKRPNSIFLRAVRGMLAYKKKSGREMVHNLKIYNGVPKSLENEEAKKMGVKEIKCKYITLEKLSEKLGGI